MITRRNFLECTLTTWPALGLAGGAPAQEQAAKIPPFKKSLFAGKPRARGRLYGTQFADGIRTFLDREILKAFSGKPASQAEMLRYAAACGQEVKKFAPIIHDELEGMAEGSGCKLEELVLITLHEELYHKGVLPKVPHCTAVGIGPPVTTGGGLIGQTWDWMESVFGMSSVLHWQRPEGPSVLAYAFPGLWVGAGLNSAGLALVWTSADLGKKEQGARVGIPSYVLLAHLLYQDSLDAVEAEMKRATNAGWFTFVMGDAKGNLLNLEGSPKEIASERHKGQLCRVGFGSRQMTGTAPDKPVKLHERCQRMYDLLAESAGKTDRAVLQRCFESPKAGISVGKSTIDMMVFDTTAKAAYLSRGPSYGVNWQKFGFGERD